MSEARTPASTVQATYYFGAPAANLKLHWQLNRSVYYPVGEGAYEGDEGDEEDEDYYGSEFVHQGDATTDG